LVPLDARIRELAAEVTAGKESDIEKARAIYDYVVDSMSYDKSGTGWGRGDIYWACDMKRGNCTDFHALFTGLNRAVGIPAKFAIGLPVPEDRGQGEIGGYHCWAEFWLDGYGWVPVDTSEARKNPAKREYFFGAHDENRVELSEGRDLVLAPEQSGEPLNFFVYPYVEVDGEPWTKVSQTFTYRDLDAEPAGGPAGGR
jgi:transglutaminase-like putative cysteine protease